MIDTCIWTVFLGVRMCLLSSSTCSSTCSPALGWEERFLGIRFHVDFSASDSHSVKQLLLSAAPNDCGGCSCLSVLINPEWFECRGTYSMTRAPGPHEGFKRRSEWGAGAVALLRSVSDVNRAGSCSLWLFVSPEVPLPSLCKSSSWELPGPRLGAWSGTGGVRCALGTGTMPQVPALMGPGEGNGNCSSSETSTAQGAEEGTARALYIYYISIKTDLKYRYKYI